MPSAGELFRGLSVSEWNKARAAGAWYEQQRRLGQSRPAPTITRAANPVLVKNTTGGDLAAGSVVELTGSSLTTLDRNHLWFDGYSRSGTCPPFAVFVTACPAGDYAEAVTCGDVLALVDVQDIDNTHGRFTSGGTTLKGCFGGPVELLLKPTSTGSQLLPVRIGPTQTIVRRAKAAADIASGASGNVNVYLNGSNKGTITAYNDWDAGDVANNDELRIAYHHDLDRWDIVKRGSGGTAAIYPMIFRDSSAYATSGISYPRGGGYGGTEYYTIAYAKTRGDRAANNINPLLATGAGMPFMEVLTTGLYAMTHMPRASVVWSGSDTQSQTSGAASAGTAHTHQVDIYNGIGLHAGVISTLQYRVGGSGSWTTLNDGGFYFLGGSLSSFDSITTPYSAGCGVALLNLTAGWQIRHLLTFAGSQSSSDHQMQNAWAQMAVHYLGATSTDYTIV